jgi:hypothetical protein
MVGVHLICQHPNSCALRVWLSDSLSPNSLHRHLPQARSRAAFAHDLAHSAALAHDLTPLVGRLLPRSRASVVFAHDLAPPAAHPLPRSRAPIVLALDLAPPAALALDLRCQHLQKRERKIKGGRRRVRKKTIRVRVTRQPDIRPILRDELYLPSIKPNIWQLIF